MRMKGCLWVAFFLFYLRECKQHLGLIGITRSFQILFTITFCHNNVHNFPLPVDIKFPIVTLNAANGIFLANRPSVNGTATANRKNAMMRIR